MLIRKTIFFGQFNLKQLILLFNVIICISSEYWTSFSSKDQRFKVFWNVPSEICANSSTGPIQPQIYGIRTNENERFYGSEVVTFYEEKLGLYPKCLYEKRRDGKYYITKRINGGLPMAVNLHLHLEKAEEDIVKAMPNETFSGLAVIDYEHWRPIFAHNWGPRSVYKIEAINRTKKEFPKLDYDEVLELAEKTFNQDARNFILETLRLGKRLRPHAKWGFYDFPLCDYKVTKDVFGSDHRRCQANFIQHNNEMMWLYNESVALYPPIYFYRKPQDEDDLRIERNFVYAKIAESQRVVSIIGRHTPVYLFSKNEYDEYSPEPKFYTKESRCIAIGIPAYYGVPLGSDIYNFKQNFSIQGVVIWSTSQNIKNRCGEIKLAMERGLGKFLLKYFHRSNKCNEKLCNNHGRCITKSIEFSDNELIEPFVCQHQQQTHRLRCLCDENYSGEHCESDARLEGRIELSSSWTQLDSTRKIMRSELSTNVLSNASANELAISEISESQGRLITVVGKERPRRQYKIWRYRRML